MRADYILLWTFTVVIEVLNYEMSNASVVDIPGKQERFHSAAYFTSYGRRNSSVFFYGVSSRFVTVMGMRYPR